MRNLKALESRGYLIMCLQKLTLWMIDCSKNIDIVNRGLTVRTRIKIVEGSVEGKPRIYVQNVCEFSKLISIGILRRLFIPVMNDFITIDRFLSWSRKYTLLQMRSLILHGHQIMGTKRNTPVLPFKNDIYISWVGFLSILSATLYTQLNKPRV